MDSKQFGKYFIVWVCGILVAAIASSLITFGSDNNQDQDEKLNSFMNRLPSLQFAASNMYEPENLPKKMYKDECENLTIEKYCGSLGLEYVGGGNCLDEDLSVLKFWMPHIKERLCLPYYGEENSELSYIRGEN